MWSLFLAASIVFTAEDAQLAFDTARDLVENCTPRDSGTIRGRIAANHILDAASAAGVDVRIDRFRSSTPLGEREFTNLYGEMRHGGPDDRWVVLVSHFDTKTGKNCPGANDGASTSGLLVAIANAITATEDPRGNVLLIWTDGEECMGESYSDTDGFWGSKRAVEYVRARGYKVQSVICADMLGDRDLSISIPSNGSPALTKIALHAAKRAGYPDLVRPIAEMVKDDHVAFLSHGYKAINLIDFSYGPGNSYWHTPADTMEHVSVRSLFRSGKVIVEMLNILL